MSTTVAACPAVTPFSEAWNGFNFGKWQTAIDPRDFIQHNYTPYTGDAGFLSGPTARTQAVWNRVTELLSEERERGGVLAVSGDTPSSITSHAPGYIDPENETIVGLQTDAPLKRGIMPFGGLRMVEQALEEQNEPIDLQVHKIFTQYRKTHNNAVFEMYTSEIRRARNSHVITGLPDAYGRGRIIGDYRRVALYGVDRLIENKKQEMQFFGARVNLAKTLLYAINGGRDEISGNQIGPVRPSISSEVLNYEEVLPAFEEMMEWLARVYVEALNIIHYSHDKYAYERLEMALHDRDIIRTLGCGIAGLSVVADSLSAIKYAEVRPVRDENGIAIDFEVKGEYPTFGNNDDRADEIAVWVVHTFMEKIRKQPVYRNAVHTQSVLTITSNVVYGKYTGNTPDGRRKGEAFAPGANPMHGRDKHGMMASALSIAKLPYADSLDGISLTSSMIPDALGRTEKDRVENLTSGLDTYFEEKGYHMNINVLNHETLLDAMEHPEKYPQLTIRVSGYAVNFVKLTREQQAEVISRTFHKAL